MHFIHLLIDQSIYLSFDLFNKTKQITPKKFAATKFFSKHRGIKYWSKGKRGS